LLDFLKANHISYTQTLLKVTTIAHFNFKKAVQPIRKCLDFIMTGYEARCDKSNPKMYQKVLEILNVKPEETVMIGDNVPIDILKCNCKRFKRSHENHKRMEQASMKISFKDVTNAESIYNLPLSPRDHNYPSYQHSPFSA